MSSPIDWDSNNASTSCILCEKTFGTFKNRRHHCRHCGRLVCEKCSSKRLVLNIKTSIRADDNQNSHSTQNQSTASRVCDACYSILTKREQIKLVTNYKREKEKMLLNSSSRVSSSLIKVFFLDGSYKTVPFDNSTTARDIASILCYSVNIALFEVFQDIREPEQYRLILPTDMIEDIVNRWEFNNQTCSKIVIPLYDFNSSKLSSEPPMNSILQRVNVLSNNTPFKVQNSGLSSDKETLNACNGNQPKTILNATSNPKTMLNAASIPNMNLNIIEEFTDEFLKLGLIDSSEVALILQSTYHHSNQVNTNQPQDEMGNESNPASNSRIIRNSIQKVCDEIIRMRFELIELEEKYEILRSLQTKKSKLIQVSPQNSDKNSQQQQTSATLSSKISALIYESIIPITSIMIARSYESKRGISDFDNVNCLFIPINESRGSSGINSNGNTDSIVNNSRKVSSTTSTSTNEGSYRDDRSTNDKTASASSTRILMNTNATNSTTVKQISKTASSSLSNSDVVFPMEQLLDIIPLPVIDIYEKNSSMILSVIKKGISSLAFNSSNYHDITKTFFHQMKGIETFLMIYDEILSEVIKTNVRFLESHSSQTNPATDATKAQPNLQILLHIYEMAVAMEGVYDYLSNIAVEWKSNIITWILKLFSYYLRLPISNPEIIAILLQLLLVEDIMSTAHVHDVVKKVIEDFLTSELYLDVDKLEFPFQLRDDQAFTHIFTMMRRMTVTLHLLVHQMIPLFPADFNLISIYQDLIFETIRNDVTTFYISNSSSLSKMELLYLLSFMNHHSFIISKHSSTSNSSISINNVSIESPSPHKSKQSSSYNTEVNIFNDLGNDILYRLISGIQSSFRLLFQKLISNDDKIIPQVDKKLSYGLMTLWPDVLYHEIHQLFHFILTYLSPAAVDSMLWQETDYIDKSDRIQMPSQLGNSSSVNQVQLYMYPSSIELVILTILETLPEFSTCHLSSMDKIERLDSAITSVSVSNTQSTANSISIERLCTYINNSRYYLKRLDSSIELIIQRFKPNRNVSGGIYSPTSTSNSTSTSDTSKTSLKSLITKIIDINANIHSKHNGIISKSYDMLLQVIRRDICDEMRQGLFQNTWENDIKSISSIQTKLDKFHHDIKSWIVTKSTKINQFEASASTTSPLLAFEQDYHIARIISYLVRSVVETYIECLLLSCSKINPTVLARIIEDYEILHAYFNQTHFLSYFELTVTDNMFPLASLKTPVTLICTPSISSASNYHSIRNLSNTTSKDNDSLSSNVLSPNSVIANQLSEKKKKVGLSKTLKQFAKSSLSSLKSSNDVLALDKDIYHSYDGEMLGDGIVNPNNGKLDTLLKPWRDLIKSLSMDTKSLVEFVKNDLYTDFGPHTIKIWSILMNMRGESKNVTDTVYDVIVMNWSPPPIIPLISSIAYMDKLKMYKK